jgi:DNA-directed RNA polymerase specialized sigma24 family protein
MASDPIHVPVTDWARISGSLLRCAAVWCHKANLPDVFDGVDAKDVVGETLAAYFGSPSQLGWDPNKAPLEIFLWTVCRNKLVDHVRRHAHIYTSVDDEKHGLSNRITNGDVSQYEQLEREDNARKSVQEIFESVSRIKKNPEELKAILSAAMRVDDPQKVNQQLASIMNIEVEKVERIKKRLRRLWERGEEFA